ncbi:hypothetical protein BJ508DRAFT_372262 [Ascobolus immersus RN42]|uniref:Uncharacterized protein n=1 Tax=Ascobolus immersus RN42 TaxID=1160509 RepID=A0A3N4IZT9_ASCIM|nr:hypothetical protein BJ508DRAFT_372262 [Ascobolus immersus RN42]
MAKSVSDVPQRTASPRPTSSVDSSPRRLHSDIPSRTFVRSPDRDLLRRVTSPKPTSNSPYQLPLTPPQSGPASPTVERPHFSAIRRTSSPVQSAKITKRLPKTNKQVNYKYATSTASDHQVEKVLANPVIDEATGEVIGHKTLMTKTVTMTLTTTVIVSKLDEDGNVVEESIVEENKGTALKGEDCKCGHWNMHQNFHLSHHSSGGGHRLSVGGRFCRHHNSTLIPLHPTHLSFPKFSPSSLSFDIPWLIWTSTLGFFWTQPGPSGLYLEQFWTALLWTSKELTYSPVWRLQDPDWTLLDYYRRAFLDHVGVFGFRFGSE